MKPNDDRWRQIDAIFSAALEVEPLLEESFLERACGEDEELRQAVAALLRASTEAGSFLQTPLLSFPEDLEPDQLMDALLAGARDPPQEDAAAEEAREPVRDPLGLSGRRISHFEVQEVLGCGGMGAVYRAQDLRLGRTVALKFLLPQYSLDALAKERFLQEARAASALDHPNICTIYEAGETEEGHLFLAMAGYAGETLRERLRRTGALPVEEAVELARQILRGLGAAHAAGIVHRDLKPGNLILTADGTLKILDFGLAKVRDLSLTESERRPGTVAYMSPQRLQTEGEDGRTDLWSLGVVLYEMLTGQLPFGAGHELASVYRILNEEPVPPSAVRAEIPRELEEIVLGLLSRDPERRDAAADRLAVAERRQGAEIGSVKVRTARGARRARVLAGAAAGLILVGGAAIFTREPVPVLNPERVLVAVFENRTGDPELDFVGSMAADWVSRGLMQAGRLEVVPVDAMLAESQAGSGGDAASAAALGRELAEGAGAGTLVTGSYYARAGAIHFEAQILDVARRRLLHTLDPVAVSRDHLMEGVEGVRQRVTGALAIILDPELTTSLITPTTPAPTFDAYRQYIEGLEIFVRMEYREAIRVFEEAAAADPGFIQPLFFMAIAHINLGELDRVAAITQQLLPARDRMSPLERHVVDWLQATLRGDAEARLRAMRRIVEIGPSAMASYQLAFDLFSTNRPGEAIRVLKRLNPHQGLLGGWMWYWRMLADAHHLRGEHRQELAALARAQEQFPDDPVLMFAEIRALAARGRTADVERRIEDLLQVPGNSWTRGSLLREAALELRAHGRTPDADRLLQRAVASDRSQMGGDLIAAARREVATTLYEAGRIAEARALLAELMGANPDDLTTAGYYGLAAARLGDRASAERILTRIENGLEPPVDPEEPMQNFGQHSLWRARIAAQLGEPDRAVRLLRRSFAEGRGYDVSLHVDSALRPLHGHPAFRALIRPRG